MAEVTLPKLSKGVITYLGSLIALGYAEYFDLKMLYRISLTMSICTSLLMIITLIVYTYNYAKSKKAK